MPSKTIKAKVSAGTKTEKVEEVSPDVFKIRVSAPPERGRANLRVIELLAEHFRIPKSRVTIISGQTFREKVFLIEI